MKINKEKDQKSLNLSFDASFYNYQSAVLYLFESNFLLTKRFKAASVMKSTKMFSLKLIPGDCKEMEIKWNSLDL